MGSYTIRYYEHNGELHAEYDVDEEGGDQVTGGGYDSEEGGTHMLAAW